MATRLHRRAILARPLQATRVDLRLATLVGPRPATQVRLLLDTHPRQDTQVLHPQATRPRQGCHPAIPALAMHPPPLAIPLLATLLRATLVRRGIRLQATLVRHTQARQATHLLCLTAILRLRGTLAAQHLATRVLL